MTWDLSTQSRLPVRIGCDELLALTSQNLKRLLNLPGDFNPKLGMKKFVHNELVAISELFPSGDHMFALAWEKPDADIMLVHYESNGNWKSARDDLLYVFTAGDLKGTSYFKHTLALCLTIAASNLLGTNRIEDDGGQIFREFDDPDRCTFPVEDLGPLALKESLGPREAAAKFFASLPAPGRKPAGRNGSHRRD